MSETVYIETSIFGYLTARSTENLIIKANMKVTQDWWDTCRCSFILYASEIVQDEAARGDAAIAAQKENQKIAVEIKSFLGYSLVSDFHLAVGQVMNYR